MKQSHDQQSGFLILLALSFVMFGVGCTRTTFQPAKQTSFAPYQGKLLLLTNEAGKEIVPGAEEIGTVRLDTYWPWLSKGGHVARWKKEAARHGANAVKFYGEGCDTGLSPWSFSVAKTYRIENLDDPRLKDYAAPAYSYYHESWLQYHRAMRRIREEPQAKWSSSDTATHERK